MSADESLRALEREAASGSALALSSFLLASERSGASPIGLVAREARILIRLGDEGGEWRHPWPVKTPDKPGEGRWWAPARGAGRPKPTANEFGDPGRFYLTPTTDTGRAWWSDARSRPFSDLGSLCEFLCAVELLEVRFRSLRRYEVVLQTQAGEELWRNRYWAVSRMDVWDQGGPDALAAGFAWPYGDMSQIKVRRL